MSLFDCTTFPVSLIPHMFLETEVAADDIKAAVSSPYDSSKSSSMISFLSTRASKLAEGYFTHAAQ